MRVLWGKNPRVPPCLTEALIRDFPRRRIETPTAAKTRKGATPSPEPSTEELGRLNPWCHVEELSKTDIDAGTRFFFFFGGRKGGTWYFLEIPKTMQQKKYSEPIPFHSYFPFSRSVVHFQLLSPPLPHHSPQLILGTFADLILIYHDEHTQCKNENENTAESPLV